MAIKFLIAFFLCWLLIRYALVDLSLLSALLRSPLAILGAVSILIVAHCLNAWRWHMLLEGVGIRLPIGLTFRIRFISAFFNNLLPGGMGGDAVRMHYAWQSTKKRATTTAMSLLVDRITGILGLLLLALSAGIWRLDPILASAELSFLLFGIACLFGGVIVIVLVGFFAANRLSGFLRQRRRQKPSRLLHAISEGFLSLRRYRRSWPSLVRNTLLAAIMHGTVLWAIVILAKATGLGNLATADYALATGTAFLANLLPVSPGGLGIGESAFDRVCSLFNQDGPVLAYGTVFLALRLVLAASTLPGLVFYITHKKP